MVIQGRRRITAYGSNYIILDETRIEENVIILPTRIITGWVPDDEAQIGATLLANINAEEIDLVIFGSGRTHLLLPAAITYQFNAHGISIESMTSTAAYGTYNLLIAEDRKVAVGLLL